MADQALAGLRVIDVAGTVATGYCAKLYADHGAEVIDVEPDDGFPTRRLAPFIPDREASDASAMHAYLSTNKQSVRRDGVGAHTLRALIDGADLVLDDGMERYDGAPANGVRMSIAWFGRGGSYEAFTGSDGGIFALNGMVRGIGPIEGPPLIPTGYQAQIVGGMTAFIGSMTQVVAGELGNRTAGVHLETSIFESCLCFTEVGVISVYNTGLEAPRMGVNRFPPTYPLGVFACADGWIGVTVLTPGQWRAFCALLGMPEFADVEMFQTSVGRLQARDAIEPVMLERIATFTTEDLFYRAQAERIPFARVPTMEELFGVDQFRARNAFAAATLPGGATLTVPAVPFRLYRTPPNFGGPVARLGEHTQVFA